MTNAEWRSSQQAKVAQALSFIDAPTFKVADREEEDCCEALTPGCCVDHTASPDYPSCETW